MCPLYVSGLIGPGDRKSIQPMAERLALGDYDQLHHFIADGVWDAAPVETELLVQADRLVGGSDAVLVVDDTAILKKGTCEQAHQQTKEELGLDHFEGRSWQGLHRHALMTMIAYAFLQHRRLATARRKKRINGPPPQPTLPAVRHAILELFARLPPQRCPYCRKWICNEQRRE
jgi:SRSO17 transposase